MGSIVLRSLSILLGIFFVFIGFMKLSPYVSKELHKELRRDYVQYAKSFPFISSFDVKLPSKWYRRTVGVLEIVCGLAMALIPNHKVKNVANVCLLLLTIISVYSHYAVGDKLERTAPALVFLFMLSGRLVVYWQVKRRENQRTETHVNGFKQD